MPYPSRLSSLAVFPSRPAHRPPDAAPPPPPKDTPSLYTKSLFARSVSSLSPESSSGPATPASPFPSAAFDPRRGARAAASSPVPSPNGLRSSGRDYLDGTDSSGSCPSAGPGPHPAMYQLNGGNASAYTVSQASTMAKAKKSVFKLAGLAKKNRSRKDLSETASVSGSVSTTVSVSEHDDMPGKPDGDDGISRPWNFQHNIHVDEGYIGLPPSWSAALLQAGFDEDEIAAIHARRHAAAAVPLTSNPRQANPYTTYSTDRPASPKALPTTSASSSTTLLDPAPRSTSLGRGRDANVQPLSMYSVASSTSGGPSTIGPPSPAPSSRAPSFSMRSIVSGIKNSLSSDSASMKDGPRIGGGTGEESDQYVMVIGDNPDEDADPSIGDETLIEPYPFDTASVSSRQTHSSRMQPQGQQTPRSSTFPHIQVQRTRSDGENVALPSPASHTPSPLAHSTSLPIPTPPRGYTFSNHSSPSQPPAPNLRPGPASEPPRTPPKRVYHVMNPSSDSYDGNKYPDPPPAYVSPKKDEYVPRKEKDGFEVSAAPLPPPNRPVPPAPVEEITGEPSGASSPDNREEDQNASTLEDNDSLTDLSDDIPVTADEIVDIYSMEEGDASRPQSTASSTPPLMIDKTMTKLAMLPPRISFHQEGNLEDWSESLFSVIGGEGKRSSILMGPKGMDAIQRKERRSTIRPISPPSTIESDFMSPEPLGPSLPGLSFGLQARESMSVVEETTEQELTEQDEAAETGGPPENDVFEEADDIDSMTTAKEQVEQAEHASPPTPPHPDVSLSPDVACSSGDPGPPPPTSSSPSKSLSETIDSLLPMLQPKSMPKPVPLVPLASPPPVALTPPRMSIVSGISGRSPVNSLFGSKPQPLPVPIPPSQIRAQLRPAPPKPPHPPPTIPLPPLRRTPSPKLPSASSPKLQLPIVPSPKAVKHNLSPLDSRPSSSQTLLSARAIPGDRDSSMSTITVTPATIATAKAEVVRTAVASVVDSDAVSLTSGRTNTVATANVEPKSLPEDVLDMGGESTRGLEQGKASAGTLESSSVLLLRDDPQWPAPPPTPVEFGTDRSPRHFSRFRTTSLIRVTQLQAMSGGTIASPISSHSSHGSSDTMMSTSTSESAPLTTPKVVNGGPSAVLKQTDLAADGRLPTSKRDTFGRVDPEGEEEENEVRPQAPETALSLSTSSAPIPPSVHPLLAQLEPHITPRNPGNCFSDLVEIAEGESGSVYAARVVSSTVVNECTERPIPSGTSLVAIKRITLPPLAFSPSLSDNSPVSNKLLSLSHELALLKDLDHEHLLLLDAVYVGQNSDQAEDDEFASAVDTSLWIRMELMERSLADVIGLVAEGLVLQERLVGRFASDILNGLDYLQRHHIAHRDVRSDNLLVNGNGVVKLTDFSNAIRVDRNAPTVNGAVGVIYWQAPEMRAGPYNALKVDAWSLGATVWELAETVPPFSMPDSPSVQMPFALQSARHVGSQWPPLTHPEHYSRGFHEFLRLCGKESAVRPGPGELLNTPFIRNACGRPVILQMLSQCRAIEEGMTAKEESSDSSS